MEGRRQAGLEKRGQSKERLCFSISLTGTTTCEMYCAIPTYIKIPPHLNSTFNSVGGKNVLVPGDADVRL